MLFIPCFEVECTAFMREAYAVFTFRCHFGSLWKPTMPTAPHSTTPRRWPSHRLFAVTWLIGALPSVAWASEAKAPAPRPHEITGGLVTSFFMNNRADETPTAWMFDIAYHYRPPKLGFWQSLRLTGGSRMGLANSDKGVLDVYGRVEMLSDIGPWTPTLGPELGVALLGSQFTRVGGPFPDEHTSLLETKMSPFYIAFVATPIRFCFSRFTVSTLEVSLGSPVTGIGDIARFQLGILHVGGTL